MAERPEGADGSGPDRPAHARVDYVAENWWYFQEHGWSRTGGREIRMPLPTGIVTFLLTDVEGSSALWDRHPGPMREALAVHDAILDDTLTRHGGEIVRDRGEGDSYFAVFASATPAVAAALEIQRRLRGQAWPESVPIRVRIGINTGEVELRRGDYWGSSINRCGRIRALASGGQVLLGEATANLARDALPEAAGLVDLGEVPLRGMDRAERIFQLAHPDLPRDFPPLQTQAPGNLPRPLTSFVGRNAELEAVAATLRQNRLVTLTGPGGAGKTRLGLEVAARATPPGGVWFADLSTLHDPALVEEAVATAVGAREEAGRPLLQTLVDRLRPEPALIVVDNCEHVLDAATGLARALLSGCADLKVLATSREPLGVAGERVWPVRQLPAEDAVRLFAERAAAARPDFALDAGGRETVARICERLDGIPLAIELAAARSRVLAPAQVLERLQDRFRLLSSADRSLDPRQQTLRAAIDWSYALLESDGRSFFAALSVLAGSFDLEAAEAVAHPAGVDALDTLDLVARLVDKSLVTTVEAAGESRYRMLETLREYAGGRLAESGRAESVQRAHLAHFLALVERLRGDDDRAGRGRRFELEIANVRAAIHAAERLDPEAGLELGTAAAAFWPVHGFVREAAESLGRAVDAAPPETPGLAYCHHELAWLHFHCGDFEAAKATFLRGAELAETRGEPELAGRCLNGAAISAGQLGRFAEAEEIVRRSIPLLRAAGDDIGLGQAHQYLAAFAFFEGRPADQLRESRAALGYRRRAGHGIEMALSEAFIGIALTQLGELEEARAALLRALPPLAEAVDRPNLMGAVAGTAQLAAAGGEHGLALELAAGSKSMHEAVGMAAPPQWLLWVERFLGPSRAAMGAEADAAWTAGYQRPLPETVELAMGFLTRGRPPGGTPSPAPPASA